MKAKDIEEVRRHAFEAGKRSTEGRLEAGRRAGLREMRERATNALATAGYPPEVFGIVAALEIEEEGRT